jgi:phenylpyruvate tautomerase PptA (4-oxalocrotonate tautomerase family)
MPFVHVHALEGHSSDEIRQLAYDITRVVCEDLEGVLPEQVWIRFDKMPHDNFSVAGSLISDRIAAKEAEAAAAELEKPKKIGRPKKIDSEPKGTDDEPKKIGRPRKIK